MKQILLLTLLLLSMLVSAQKATEAATDYYRFVPICEDPTLIVKSNNADSIVTYEIRVSQGKVDDYREIDGAGITSYVINRGDTLLCLFKKNEGSSQLYLSSDGRHLSHAIVTDSLGNVRTVARDSCIALNRWVNKMIQDGYVHDSIMYTYYKDSLVQEKYYPQGYEPRSTSTMKFDADSRLIEIVEENNYSNSSIRINYDSNGIWKSLDGTFDSRYEKPEHKTATVETELNDRGDWVKMYMYEDGKFAGGVLREIFYKKEN